MTMARVRKRHLLACTAGASAVEFALLAPVLFFILIGVFELGRALWTLHSINHAVQETARFAMLNKDVGEEDLQAYALERLPGLDPSRATLTLIEEVEDDGSFLVLRGEYAFQPGAGMIPIGPMTLTGRTRVPR
jgi:Flp pilus assembly protein TadG